MFKIGDLIVYGNTGVCKITDITTIKIKGLNGEQLYYVLEALYKNCKISTPISNDKVIMRSIITKDEANMLIDSIPNIDAEAYEGKGFRQLSEHYDTIIKTCDTANLVAMTMSIHDKKVHGGDNGVKYGATDDHFMKLAEDLLFGELAAALDIDKSEVHSYITNRLASLEAV